MFHEFFLYRPVSSSHVRNVVIKITATFCVGHASRSGRPSVKTEEIPILVSGRISDKTTVHEILKKHKFHHFCRN